MFKIGDKVRVKSLTRGLAMHYPDVMDKLCGLFGIVVEKVREGEWRVQIDADIHHWVYGEYDLELVNDIHVGDVIRITHIPRALYKVLEITGKDQYTIREVNGERIWVFQHLPKATPVKKYPLRNDKGHFIKCDRDVIEDVKAIIPVAKGVVAKQAIIAPVEAIKPLPEPVKEAFDLRAALTKKAGDDGICNYAFEFTKSYPRYHPNDGCHARFRWSGERTIDNEIANIALVIKPYYEGLGEEYQKNYIRFVHYILNDSPWASCFITKDAGEAVDKGVLMNVDKHIDHLVGAAVALRVGNEHNHILEHFTNCLDKGYDGNVSFLVGTAISRDSVRGFPHHSVLCGNLPWKNVVEFFKKGYAVEGKPMRDDKSQTAYHIWNPICNTPNANYYGGVNGLVSLSVFTKACAVQVVTGEGFDRNTVFDYEATMTKMAEAFKTELENVK